MFCNKCGEKIKTNDLFCRNCGASLGVTSQSEIPEMKMSKKEFVCRCIRKKGVLCSIMVVLTMTGLLCYAKWSDVSAMDQKQSAAATETGVGQTVVAKEKTTQTVTVKETTTQEVATQESASTKQSVATKENVTKEVATSSSATKATVKPANPANSVTSTMMQKWNGAETFTNSWNTMNSVSTDVYNFSDGNGSIEVKVLSTTSTGNLVEAKVGKNENCSIRMEVYPGLLKMV